MKWISVAVVGSSPDDVRVGNHYAVWCVSDTGELWCYIPHQNKWSKITPPEVV